MAATVVDGTWVGARALGELNANLLDGSYSESTSDTDLFADWEVQKARLETDCELYGDISLNPQSDFWNQLSQESAEFASGTRVGTADTFKFQGALGRLQVKMGDASWRTAHEPVHLAQIMRWRNSALYTSLTEASYGRFCITPDLEVHFLGLFGRMRYVPEYEFDDAGYLHRCPERTTPAQIRGTIVKLYKDGVDPSMIQEHAKQYAQDRADIRRGIATLADFVPYRRPQPNA